MIRPARDTELDALTALVLRSKAHWGYSDEFMRACAAELTVSPALLPHAFVIEHAGELLGVCAWTALTAERAQLELLFVEPRAIGHRFRCARTCCALAADGGGHVTPTT